MNYKSIHICRFIIEKGKLYKYVPSQSGLVKKYVREADENDLRIFGDNTDIIAQYGKSWYGTIELTKRYAICQKRGAENGQKSNCKIT